MARRLQLSLLLFAPVLLVSGASEDRRLSIYSNAANYSLAVQSRQGVDYVGLLEALEPLGTVSAKTSGHHWKLRFESVDGEFTDGKIPARVRGANIDLAAGFVLENGRGLVPLSSLPILLPRFLGGPVTFHEAARRLFVGDAAVHFTAQISRTNPPTLVVNFTSPVSPTITTEPGRLGMRFTREGLVGPATPTITFDSKAIPSATFQEDNGAAALTISGTVPLMASFSNDNRTITIAPPQASAAMAQEHPAPTSSPTPSPGTASPGSGLGETRRYFAVIDAAHGGSESGAALADQLLEKDITLAVARGLRQELAARQLSALLVRDGDVAMTTEQRASLVNAVHPAIYVCFHASAQGAGVRVFSSLVPHGSSNQGPFVEWESAQSAFLMSSQKVAARLGAALQTLQVPVHSLSAPLRPLNSIRTTAVAIEIAPPDLSTGPGSTTYQDSVARMVAIGLAAMHDELEAGP
jgi:N-acetylmuramoyl-L-alanine amidase